MQMETMIDFNTETWRGYHETGYVPALTGTAFVHMLKYYELENILFKDMNVLEIGVGLGLCIQGFHSRGCNVFALDICEEAFHKIRDYIAGSYLHTNVENLPEGFVDLAVSHLVTQHMSESDILKQFPAVIKSLKSSGSFRVQFAGSTIPEENNIKKTIVGMPADNKVSMLGGRMARTSDYATELVKKCGGTVTRTSTLKHFPKYQSYWYWLEVIK